MGGVVGKIVGAIASAVVGVASGGAGFTLTAFFKKFAFNLVVGAALSVAQRALTPKPKMQKHERQKRFDYAHGGMYNVLFNKEDRF